jgi:hypothetical protein
VIQAFIVKLAPVNAQFVLRGTHVLQELLLPHSVALAITQQQAQIYAQLVQLDTCVPSSQDHLFYAKLAITAMLSLKHALIAPTATFAQLDLVYQQFVKEAPTVEITLASA